jgi:hypothetical protein
MLSVAVMIIKLLPSVLSRGSCSWVTEIDMERVSVDILGRHLGVALSSDEKTYEAFTVYGFRPAVGVVGLPELCDVVIDCAHGWIIPIRGDGGGEAVNANGQILDLVDLLHSIPNNVIEISYAGD